MEPEIREKVTQTMNMDIKQLPALPEVYLRVKKAYEDPSLSVASLESVLRYDQSMTISILRLANSAFYGFRHKISSISQAIMMIGLRDLYGLVLSVSLMGLFPMHERDDESPFPARRFWEHSLAVGIASRALGTTMGYPHPEDLFVAGLIHDIGKVIEKMYLKEQFNEICNYAKTNQCRFIDAEQAILGFTHSEVGEILTEKWQFPDFLRHATSSHHKPLTVEDPRMQEGVCVIQLADSFARALGIGWAGDPYVPPIETDVLKKLHLLPYSEMDLLAGKVIREYQAAVKNMMV